MMIIMDRNFLGLVISVAYLAFVIGIGYLIYIRKLASSDVVRKVVHIGVSNWWFVLVTCFDTPLLPVIGTGFFIIMNGLATWHGWTQKFFGLKEEKKHHGLVYYPASLLGLVLLVYVADFPLHAATAGVLAMGYGDGIAGLIGHRFGRRKLPGSEKTWLGTGMMFLVSCVVVAGVLLAWNLSGRMFVPVILSTAFIAALLEAVSPYGLDNLSVPFGVAFWMMMPWW
ncbi:diacylglycerol/polyprenol kinase family protein [Parasphaerochaeta coccoides]|uniref:Phosphatidate cytidylyltransferase n=1 Tax=Parasphaerochaeta coccoides (strain ATCC BAA-1237 / DSM 17374 / SPN1) TaxID=760011 RepID=F4GKN6_PARC1|nr:phosphatidate cytidylyltransferase [Parasphaerochaeta coccoides]AEC01445.1 phosphatidate cytidylyltransferase [Parasphaerochaeta coccoides DSM 17374]